MASGKHGARCIPPYVQESFIVDDFNTGKILKKHSTLFKMITEQQRSSYCQLNINRFLTIKKKKEHVNIENKTVGLQIYFYCIWDLWPVKEPCTYLDIRLYIYLYFIVKTLGWRVDVQCFFLFFSFVGQRGAGGLHISSISSICICVW